MPPQASQRGGLRPKLRQRLNHLRHKFRKDPGTNIDPTLIPLLGPTASALAVQSSPSFSQTHDAAGEPASGDNPPANVAISLGGFERNSSLTVSTLGPNVVVVASDLWSSAYREAVESLGEDIDVAILKGENVAQLFRQLGEIDSEVTQDSAFLRGVRYLQSIQVPLERFKMALDLAAPLTTVAPLTGTALGVVQGVTAIAISLSTTDLEFATKIGEMLEQISYIDDCDTLGQKAERVDVHKALVSVYQKLLEFYNVAFEILTRRGARLVMKMTLENQRLPDIVKEFLRHADLLRKIVQKATWEIVEDIKTMLYDDKISRWLGSDKMSRQSLYHADLQAIRADRACEFLLTDAKFIDWYRASDSRQLVILGDMGHGKTVAMAYLVDELRRRNEYQLPRPKLCYHYCRDDETGQAIYILSALILSLLEQLTGLKKTFFEWYKEALASGNFEPATNASKLEEFLQTIVETLDRPLFIVIDGLDECDEASRCILLKALGTLSQRTSRLKTILSSRPQEEILEQLDGMASIYLYADTRRDEIIAKETVERQLPHLSKDIQALVTQELSRSAQGSAIWTKMVIELIAIRRIRALDPMQTFLEMIPQPRQLSQLYASLFSRHTSDDPENEKLAATALEILVVARRPLSILELAWAVALSATRENVTTVATLAKFVDHQRVMSLIQPFVARVDFSAVKKRQVRLVHQSAKEFIIGAWASSQPVAQGTAISATPSQAPTHRRTARLETRMLDVCIRYLLLDDIGSTGLFSDEQVAIQELPQECDLFNDDAEPPDYDPYCTWEVWEEDMIRYDPTERGFGEFFVYASCYWLDHFGAITTDPFPDLGNVEKLCQAGSTQLKNWIEQNCRPDCTIKARFVFDSSLYDPLSITSLYGSEAVLLDMLESSDFDNGKFLSDAAMVAADQIIQWGDLSRLRMLFSSGSQVGSQLQNLDFFRLVMKSFMFCKDRPREEWDVVFDLVDDISDILVQERWGNELLCTAASMGCMPIIRRLMDRAQEDLELRAELLSVAQTKPQAMSLGKQAHQSIGEAVLDNHVDVVAYLLGHQGMETHLQHRNSRGENVLHLAARLCNPAMFQMLAPCFKEGIHQTDDQNDTVLMRVIKSPAASKDRCESAQVLLMEGAVSEKECPEGKQQELLQLAWRLGDADMCDLLVRVGKLSPLSASNE